MVYTDGNRSGSYDRISFFPPPPLPKDLIEPDSLGYGGGLESSSQYQLMHVIVFFEKYTKITFINVDY